MRILGGDKHLKLILSKSGSKFEAIGFGLGKKSTGLKQGDNISVLCEIGMNDFYGTPQVQLVLRDIKNERNM